METPLRLAEQEAIEQFLGQPGEESFRELFLALAPRVIRYFRSRGCDPAVAEDLTQDVMLLVFRHTAALRRNELFRPWLFRIMRNALLQFIRRSGRQVATVPLDGELREPGAVLTDPLSHSRLDEWLRWLEPDERRIMTLRYVEELEYHEIADLLAIPTGTVQWKIFHSKRKLAARFRESGESNQ